LARPLHVPKDDSLKYWKERKKFFWEKGKKGGGERPHGKKRLTKKKKRKKAGKKGAVEIACKNQTLLYKSGKGNFEEKEKGEKGVNTSTQRLFPHPKRCRDQPGKRNSLQEGKEKRGRGLKS